MVLNGEEEGRMLKTMYRSNAFFFFLPKLVIHLKGCNVYV